MDRKNAQICRAIAVICLFFFGAPGLAADVVILYPERTTLVAANDNNGLRFQFYHVDVADFKVGDLVLTKSNFLGEVLAIRPGQLYVEGRFLSGWYKPLEFVKETSSVRGIQIGSHIKDGSGQWGKLVRAWEDGRVEIAGRWYASFPFHVSKMKIVEVVPPKLPANTMIGRLCEKFMSLW